VLAPLLNRSGWIGNPPSDEEKTYIIRIIGLLKPRMKTLCEFTPQAGLFFIDPSYYEEAAVRKYWMKPELPEQFRSIMDSIESLKHWDAASIEQWIRRKAEELGLKAGDLIHPVRLALTGSGSSPGLFEVMEILGRERVLRRLAKALESISCLSFSP
jgi:glutamyl/glutaminyl-tRNA synthetase